MADIVTREDLLARVQRLAPAIREYADAGERERHLADPVVGVCSGYVFMLCST